MDQLGQNPPPIPENATPQNPSQAATGQATTGQPAAAAAVATAKPPLGKKRKPNANKKRERSIAWDHFVRLPDEEEPIAACKHCHIKFRCDSQIHGTSNMKAHITRCPEYPYSLINDPNQTTLNFKPGEKSSLVSTSTRFDADNCKKAVAIFVIVDEQPFKVVEGDGFRYMMSQMQPQFTVPSRRTIARHCYQLYLEEKQKLKNLFKSDCSRVALTTDCWTSIQNLNYLTLTAHFIDNKWRYQKRIISFCVVPNHKGETVGRKVEEVLREWGIRNVSTITVDNASSNDVAVAYLKKKLNNMNRLVGDGEFFHVRCCAHILNLVVSDGLKDMSDSISSIRHAVRFVRSSPQRSAKFNECKEMSNIVCKKMLCLDVPTRWNSTYMMLNAAEKYQPAFDKLDYEDSSYAEFFGTAGIPTTSDWDNVRVFEKFLKLFYDATKQFSASQCVTLHAAFCQLASIHIELNNSALNLNSILANMGMEMRKKYEKYWGKIENINQLLYFGVIFDPRYKLRYVEWSFQSMYVSNSAFATKLFNSVKVNLFKMYNWYKDAYELKNSVGQQPVRPSVGGEIPIVSEILSTQARESAFKQHLREKDSIDKQNELERFLGEPNIDATATFEILGWWKQNSDRYPVLSTLVRDLFATPVSTVASESAFSTGGRVLDTYRSSLSPEMAEALICTQNWLKPSFFQFKHINLDEEFEDFDNIVAEFQGGVFVGDGAAGVSSSSQSQPINIGSG